MHLGSERGSIMTVLVIYDSVYGNTARIAAGIGSAISDSGGVRLIKDVDPKQLPHVDLLVVGSPTQGGQTTPAMRTWLAQIPRGPLVNTRFAAFDTRLASDEHGVFLRALMGLIGWAAPKISLSVAAKGGIPVTRPEGFIVSGKEGPLKPGELERAAAWGASLMQQTAAKAA